MFKTIHYTNFIIAHSHSYSSLFTWMSFSPTFFYWYFTLERALWTTQKKACTIYYETPLESTLTDFSMFTTNLLIWFHYYYYFFMRKKNEWINLHETTKKSIVMWKVNKFFILFNFCFILLNSSNVLWINLPILSTFSFFLQTIKDLNVYDNGTSVTHEFVLFHWYSTCVTYFSWLFFIWEFII